MKNISKYVLALILIFPAINIAFSQEKIYTSPEVMPQYPGGDGEMMKYLTSLKFSEALVENATDIRIISRFIVTKKGKIKNIEILKSADKNIDTKFVKHIQAMPDWKPAMQDGEKVDCYYTIPMNIRLQK